MKNYIDLKHNDKNRRRYNYNKLKGAGFNSYEANRFKDFSTKKIISLISARKSYNGEIQGLAGGIHDKS